MSEFAQPLAPNRPTPPGTTDLPGKIPPQTALLGPDSFEDNLDNAHPYTRNIELPVETLSVLSVKLRMRTKAYRYYVSSAVSSAGSAHTHTLNGVNFAVNTGDASAGTSHTHLPASAPDNFVTSSGLSQTSESTHTHGVTITPGIVETTTPATMAVVVDGNTASASALSLDEFDLIPYLTKDSLGRVTTGLHTVMFTPNINGRIQATIKGILLLSSAGR